MTTSCEENVSSTKATFGEAPTAAKRETKRKITALSVFAIAKAISVSVAAAAAEAKGHFK